MAKVFNKVKQLVASAPGLGAISLGAAFTGDGFGWQTFAAAGAVNTDVIDYFVYDGTAWEANSAAYSSAGPSIARGFVASSTGSALTLSASAVVYCSPLASNLIVNGGAAILGSSNGGTGQASLPASLGALFGYNTQATAGATTTLTAASVPTQVFTGTLNQTVVLPVTSTLVLGMIYEINNNSTGTLTVQSSGLNTICTIPPGLTVSLSCILTSGTTAASWDFDYTGIGSITGTGAMVLSSSPTLVTPLLGTPTSGNLANCSGYSSSNLSGAVPLTLGGTGQITGPQGFTALQGVTSTATAAGTTTLTNASSLVQVFTGSTTQTLKLPDVTTIPLGTRYLVINQSTGALGIQTSSATSVITHAANSWYEYTSIQTSGNTAASWAYTALPFNTNGLPAFAGGTGTNGLTGLIKGNGTSACSVAVRNTDFSLLTQATAQNSTTGTAIDFTGIPTTAKLILVLFNGFSTSGSSNYLVQIGSGSPTTTGYLGSGGLVSASSSSTSFTTGFGIVNGSGGSATILHGVMIIANVSGNIWVAGGSLTQSDAGRPLPMAGQVSLAGVLDRVRITTVNGTDTFDAGSVNIMYF